MVRLVMLVFGLILAVCSPALAADPLASSIKDIQHAVDTRNMALLERRADLPALINQATTAFMTRLDKDANSLPPALALMAAAANTPEARASLASLLGQEVLRFARYGVASGHFAGKATGTPPSGLIAPLLRDASIGRKEVSLASPSQTDPKGGRRAQINVKDYGNDRTYQAVLRFVPADDGWKAVEILNLDALMARLSREAGEAAANQGL